MATTSIRLIDHHEAYSHVIKEIKAPFGNGCAVQTVVYGGVFLQGLEAGERSDLLQAIGKLPQLQEIHFVDHAVIDIGDLAGMIKHARKLTVLDMKHVSIEGDRAALHELCLALFKHTSLQQLSLVDFDSSNAQQVAEHFLKAFSGIPTVRSIHIEVCERLSKQVTLSSTSILPLCRSQSLCNLNLTGFALDHGALVNFIGRVILKEQEPLRSLALCRSNLDDGHVNILARSLSNSQLQQLNLSHNEKITEESCRSLSEAVSSSVVGQHLQILSLNGCDINENGVGVLASLLDSGRSVVVIDVHVPPSTSSDIRTKILKSQQKRIPQRQIPRRTSSELRRESATAA